MSIQPYTISVPQSKIDKLKSKLAAAEFPAELDGAAWDLGAPLADVERLTRVWEKWDWRQAEEKLNAFPHYTAPIEVDGFGNLDIHFIHQKSDVQGAIPLLFVHGWPGCFLEVIKLLPLLAQRGPKDPAFHVVAPSLPNFGFSEGPSRRGFAGAQYAETCHKLMLKLGYKEYVTQGGDWGTFITRALGILYPESVKASHINAPHGTPPKYTKNPILALQHNWTPYTDKEKAGFARTKWFREEGAGYFSTQSTKPQTLSYALHDSPVALLAWIYEKLHDWTDSYAWTDDEILTWISIYAFSRAGPGAASLIYYEVIHSVPSEEAGHGRVILRADTEGYVPHVKLGLTFSPKELFVVPKSWARTQGNIVYEAENEHGGHFYAYELPHLLARDMKVMFGKGGGAYGVVKGKEGYDSRPNL